MIICEGPDGAGKTTLVERLSKQFDLEIGRRAIANRDEIYKCTVQDTFDALGEAIRGTNRPKIWDRLYFSEFVYAPVVGRPCQFTGPLKVHIDELLAILQPPLILCLPPLEVVLENVERSKQMDGVKAGLTEIYRKYKKLSLQYLTQPIIYDYTRPESIEPALDRVGEYLDRREERSW